MAKEKLTPQASEPITETATPQASEPITETATPQASEFVEPVYSDKNGNINWGLVNFILKEKGLTE